MSTYTLAKPKKKVVPFVNKTVGKKELNTLLSEIYAEYGTAKTANLANNLKNLGFKFATLAGITISIEDLKVPDGKKGLIKKAEDEIDAATARFLRGDITEVERYTMVIDTWSETTQALTQMVVETFDRMNPIYMMAFSGARGNISQVRQLVGMRGLMADSQGQIIDLPIKSNFREGLTVTEYIISSYGARKGLVDTALKTADSGYLTRRLVDVAQDVIITEPDCGTVNGIWVEAIAEGEKVMVPLNDRIVSRTAAKDIVDKDGTVLVERNQVIDLAKARAITSAGIERILVRSPLSCETRFGVCQFCYGWSLTRNKIVDMGEAIGIMAAQSIGEPGTQLTMRTFHTGGVFSGASHTERIKAKADGQIVSEDIPTREYRTRHGNSVNITLRDAGITIKGKDGKTYEHALPVNAQIIGFRKGDTVKKDDVIAEFDPAMRGDVRRLTERATKDITAEKSGELRFESFEVDERRDRQGNISRTATRGGTIWVLGGDVYTLPGGAELLVDSGQVVFEGDALAETIISTEQGGQVRLPADLELEEIKVGKETLQAIVGGKELTVVIASIAPTNAKLVQTRKELIWQLEGSGDEDAETEKYIIKIPPGSPVENGSVVAELIDETYHLPSSGEIRYIDLEVDEHQVITVPGKVCFVPEEIHQVSKDSSLKSPNTNSGDYVKAGTEVVAGIVTRSEGYLEIVEDNDIIHEVIVRPGQQFRVEDASTIAVEDGQLVEKGTKVAPGVKAEARSIVSISMQMDEPDLDDMESTEDIEDAADGAEYAMVLLRPVVEYDIKPQSVNIDFAASTEEAGIQVAPVTHVQFRDGDKVRQIEGAPLLKTSLVLTMEGNLTRLKGLAELVKPEDPNSESDSGAATFNLVVLENLTVRRESADAEKFAKSTTQVQLLVKDGQIVDKKTPLVKTQVLAAQGGTVSLGAQEAKDVRRLALITPEQLQTVKLADKPVVEDGTFVRMGQPISAGSKPTLAEFSGRVTSVDGKELTLHVGRPYLISVGTQLHLQDRAITQQGDLMATLIFERQKTGDIVQGLPKVEELLEGRKPKETCVLAPYAATVETFVEDDVTKVYLVSDAHGRQEVPIPVGANILVENKQVVEAGLPITDGSINPHDLLEVKGIASVRQYLVDEVQRVYRSQGVEIGDKHIETIVRQMTRKMRIDDGGDSYLMPGEMVDEKEVLAANEALKEQKSTNLATGHAMLLGITKASLNTESFISAASFQETTRVLTEAAVEGRRDVLRGLKENVIIGRLIPAGTGFVSFKDERTEMHEEHATVSKSVSRKPAAILQEIETLFGVTDDNIAEFMEQAVMVDEEDVAQLTSTEGEGILPLDDDLDAEDALDDEEV